ncbi:MAG: hypothetical protein AB3N23_05530 [Paracoccaceae bacterium]
MHRFIAVLVCSAFTGFVAPAGIVPGTGSVAIAAEGGDGDFVFGKNGGKNAANAPKQPKGKQAKHAKPKNAVPKTHDIHAKKTSTRRIQQDLDRQAKKDGLKGLATNRKQMDALKVKIDRERANAKNTKEFNEVSNISRQLARYASQKANPALKANAKAIQSGLATLNALDMVKARQAAHQQAVKADKIGKVIEAKVELEFAVERYKVKRKQVNKAVRGMYPVIR